VVSAVRSAGVASVVFFTFRFHEATQTWLTQAARTRLAGGAGIWLNSLGESPAADSAWRQERGALWDLTPHALSLLVPALGAVTWVQAAAGLRDTVHLTLTHESGAVSTVTVSHTASPLSTGIEFFVHGDGGRLVLFPEISAAGVAYRVAIDDLMAAAMTGGTHACDVGFARDVVQVLETAGRALASGCREPVAG
jgi:predicted dehydrogenase